MNEAERAAGTPDPLLITGGHVVTGTGDEHPAGSLLLVGGRIAAIGSAARVAAEVDRLESGVRQCLAVRDAAGRLVLPGLVNPHWHEVLGRGTSALLGSAARPDAFDDRHDRPGPFASGGDVRVLSATFDAGYQFADLLEPDEARAVADFSVWQQLRGGTTMLGDFGSMNQTPALLAAVTAAGIRAALSVWASDGVCAPGESGFRRTRDAAEVLERLDDLHARAVDADRIGVMPTTIYPTNMSDELAAGLAERAERWDAPLATHAAALPDEIAVSTAAFGRSPIRRLADLGWLTPRLLLAHTAWLDEEDVELLVASGVKVTHSPAKYGFSGESPVSGTGRLAELRRRGVVVSLSTDGDGTPLGGMIEAMRLGWAMHNESGSSNVAVRPSDALAMSTALAAESLGMAAEIGTLEVGKRADVVLVRADDWRYLLRPRPLEGLVALGATNDVDTVIVGGAVVLDEGAATTLDERAVQQRYVEAMTSIAQRVYRVDAVALSRLIAGSPSRPTSGAQSAG